MLKLYLAPTEALPEYERMVRWMYFATGTVPAAYLQLVSGFAFSNAPDSEKKLLETALSPEYLERMNKLEQECIDVAAKVFGDHMVQVLSRNNHS